MSKIALNVAIECKPESRDAIVRALQAHRARCLRDEPGTLQFEVMVPEEDRSRIFLFELYVDESALTAHSAGSSIARYREEANPMIVNAVAHRCSLGNDTAP